jgi:hypothetical protein
MPNSQVAYGLRPIFEADGSPWSGTCTEYFVPATDATALYVGDPVVIAGSADADGVPTVTRATAASAGRITGAVVGFRPSATIIANGYRAASTGEYVLVADGPNLTYTIAEDSVGGALAATSVGLNADLIAGTGNRAAGSGFLLDSSTAATTATLQLRILGLNKTVGGEIGNYAQWYVRINLPTETGAAGSTGV